MGLSEKGSRQSSSSKHKSKHRHHRHHHHKKKKKSKSHHHKKPLIELDLKDKVLQNALDCLETGALSAIKEGCELTPELIEDLVSDSLSKTMLKRAAGDSSCDTDHRALSSIHETRKSEEESEDKDGRGKMADSDHAGDEHCSLVTDERSTNDQEVELEEEVEGRSEELGEAGSGEVGGAGNGEVGGSGEMGGADTEGRGVGDVTGKSAKNQPSNLLGARGSSAEVESTVVGDLKGMSPVVGTAGRSCREADVESTERADESVSKCGNQDSKEALPQKKSPSGSRDALGTKRSSPLGAGEVGQLSEQKSSRKYRTRCLSRASGNVSPVRSKIRKRSQSRSVSPVRSKTRRRSRLRSMSPVRSRIRRSKSRNRPPARSKHRCRSRSRSMSPVRYKNRRSGSRSISPVRSKNRKWSRSRSCTPIRSKNRRSRSRSISPVRSKNRNRSRSRSCTPVRSKNRTRSRSRSMSAVRSKNRKLSRSRSRTRVRSKNRRKSKSRSLSPVRSGNKIRSHFRSRYVCRRSHSKSRLRDSRGKNRHRKRRSSGTTSSSTSRSRSKSCSLSRPRYHSRNGSRHSRHHNRSRQRHFSSSSRSSSPTRSGFSSSLSRFPQIHEDVEQSIATIAHEFSNFMQSNTKQFSLLKLTNLCKGLQKEQEMEKSGDTSKRDEGDGKTYRAPFAVRTVAADPTKLVFHNNIWKMSNQVVAERNMIADVRPLTDKFPVSAGLQHKATVEKDGRGGGGGGAVVGGEVGGREGGASTSNVFGDTKELNINDLAVKRVLANARLKSNPADIEAHSILVYVEQQTRIWADSRLPPGQFTGQQKISALTPEDHKAGYQAWAKKKMFHDLAPVMSGFGMKMMRKMGWNVGEALGKMGMGCVEPLVLDVKMDRHGLTTPMDKKNTAGMGVGGQFNMVPKNPLHIKATNPKAAHLVEGKHPVSALQEICTKKHWGSPNYELIHTAGPSHKKTFLFSVTTPGGTFRATNECKSKKQAKMEAAKAALEGLGLIAKT